MLGDLRWNPERRGMQGSSGDLKARWRPEFEQTFNLYRVSLVLFIAPMNLLDLNCLLRWLGNATTLFELFAFQRIGWGVVIYEHCPHRHHVLPMLGTVPRSTSVGSMHDGYDSRVTSLPPKSNLSNPRGIIIDINNFRVLTSTSNLNTRSLL
jgi:hypothetical protein